MSERVEEINPEDDWKLDKIELEFQKWGEDKGNYSGRISFSNGSHESFSFKIRPEMAEPYIKLIGDDIVKGARNLGDRLVKSLGLVEAAQSPEWGKEK